MYNIENIKLKKSAVFVFITSFIVMLLSAAFFTYLRPALKFVYNEMPKEQGVAGAPVLKPGDNVLEPDAGKPVSTATPSSSNEPLPTPNATPSPGSSGDSSILYAPDPRIPGVSTVFGSSLSFSKEAHNILVLGVDGRSSQLYDTIMIVSINESAKEITVASISRDAYVPYSRDVAQAINKKGYGNSVGIYKINAAHFIGSHILNYQDGKFDNKGVNFLCSVLTEMLPNANCEIDEYVHINQSGFMELVDIIGGVWIDIPEDWYNGNGQLVFAKGENFLNSSQALTFVMSRTRYNSSGQRIATTGDPYRKANQLSFMRAFASQAATVENIPKIPSILASLSKNVYHSFNSVSKISAYSSIAMDYAKGKYSLNLYVVTGPSINPVGDSASYVDLMS